MESIRFFLNNVEVNPPFNWQELSLEMNFDKDVIQSQVKLNDWRFVRENATVINDWVQSGITGGVGIFEGIPFRIEITDGPTTETPFNGYLDLTEGLHLACDDVTTTAKEKAKIDWLNDVASSFSFEYLYEEGIITQSDFIWQPYILSSVPNYRDSMLAAMVVFSVSTEVESALTELIGLSVEIATTDPIEIDAIIRAALYVVYLSLLILALIKIINDFLALIIQPVKYHAGMKAKTLFEKGCEHLGLTFKSSIFDDEFAELVIMPQKYYVKENLDDSRIKGFITPDSNEQVGYYKGTFADYLLAMKTTYNGKYQLTDNGELIFERKDYAPHAPGFTIPPIEQRFQRYNTNECHGNYLVEFLTDGTERNTIDDYTGTSYQVTLRPKTYHDNQLVLLKGQSTRTIPFALTKRKEEFTVPELIIMDFLNVFDALINGLVAAVNGIIKVVNTITKTINAIIKALKLVGIKVNAQIKLIKPLPKSNLSLKISNRLGMMLLESDYFSVPKVFIIQRGSESKKNKISAINSQVLTARYLWNNYHYIDSFYPSTDRPNGNQYIIKEYNNVPFCLDNYMYFRDNNYLKDSDGREGELISLLWNPFKQTANIRVKLSELYTNNFRKVEYEPSGK